MKEMDLGSEEAGSLRSCYLSQDMNEVLLMQAHSMRRGRAGAEALRLELIENSILGA